MREFELIDHIQSDLAQRGLCGTRPNVIAGIGDDVAVLDLQGRPLAVTIDTLAEGVHFDWAQTTPRAVGYKAAAVTLSDLAAGMADPLALVVALALPTLGDGTVARELMAGIADACAPFAVPVVGGDIVRARSWVVTTTGLGAVASSGAPGRGGAQVGDLLYVTGALGGSILGRHLAFMPRLAASHALRALSPTALMDLSDGLAGDLRRLCRASHVGAALDAAQLPIHDDAYRLARQTGRPALEHALSDGEDFELLFTLSPSAAKRLAANPLGVITTCIGRIEPPAHGITIAVAGAPPQPLAWEGYDHG
jgi:thiamine-monophosphate kinase